MASHTHLEDNDAFGADFSGNTRRSGNKRSFGCLNYNEDDIFSSKKANSKVGETGMILKLGQSLEDCKDTLATCKTELEAAKSEIQRWHSSFQHESFIPAGTTPEPKLVINYLQTLKSSEESLREQLDKAKKKEAAFIVTFAKHEQEIAELKNNYNVKVGVGSSLRDRVGSSSVGEGSGQNRPPPDDLNTWIDVTKGAKNRRVLGFCNHMSSSAVLGSGKHVSSQSVHSHAQPQIQNGVVDVIEQQVETQLEVIIAEKLPSMFKTLFLKYAESMGISFPLPSQPPQTNDPPTRVVDDFVKLLPHAWSRP